MSLTVERTSAPTDLNTIGIPPGQGLISRRQFLPLAVVEPIKPERPPTPSFDTQVAGTLDVYAATPRQIADVSLDLYAAGLLSYEDYTALAFQPELHPDYNRTIGALTGEPAAPDRKRDFVDLWSERLQFELRHSSRDAATVQQSSRIHDLLRALGTPTQLKL